MIQISAHIESAPVDLAQISAIELPQSPPDENIEQPENGTFAKILAVLLGDLHGDPPLNPEDGKADNVLLAGNDEFSIEFEADTENKSGLEHKKIQRNKKPGTDELDSAVFPEQNQNVLLGPDLLLKTQDIEGLNESNLTGKISSENEKLPETVVEFHPESEQTDLLAMTGATGSQNETEEIAADDTDPATGRKNAPGKGKFAIPDGFTIQNSAEDTDSRTLSRITEETERLLKNGEGKKGQSRLEELRSRERRPDRASIEVKDLRTVSSNGDNNQSGDQRLNVSFGREANGDGGHREITLELHLPDQGQKMSSAETSWETRAGQAFEDILARELHENFNNDIIRHASMILRDEGKGTIRLALKPESLGNVKIRLEMAENKITGHIVVETEEAFRAFDREIHSLEQSFKDSGFQSANLEMSLASDGRSFDQYQQWAPALMSGYEAASRYEAQEWAEKPLVGLSDLYQQRQTTINVLA